MSDPLKNILADNDPRNGTVATRLIRMCEGKPNRPFTLPDEPRREKFGTGQKQMRRKFEIEGHEIWRSRSGSVTMDGEFIGTVYSTRIEDLRALVAHVLS